MYLYMCMHVHTLFSVEHYSSAPRSARGQTFFIAAILAAEGGDREASRGKNQKATLYAQRLECG